MILFKFIEGPIFDDALKTDTVSAHTIGATAIFKGTVRADAKENKFVTAIEFTSHEKIAIEECLSLMERTKQKFGLISIKIFHSLGKIKTGETCFMVMVESAHRKEAFESITFLVDDFKKNVPVFGKELFNDGNYAWKENTYN